MFNLLTSAEIKQLSRASDWGTHFDYLLDQIIIPGVTLACARYCRRPDWDLTARVEYFDPKPNQSTLFLSSPPVAAAQVGPPLYEALRLYEDTTDPPVYGVGTELTSGFVVYPEQGKIVRRLNGFIGGPQSVKVTYVGGYLVTHASPTVPADLHLAAIIQTQIYFDGRERFGLSSVSLEGGSQSFTDPQTLPSKVKMLLDPYKIQAL